MQHPNEPIELSWRSEFEEVLSAVTDYAATHEAAEKILVAKALLELLKEEVYPTPSEVIDRVRRHPPLGGWKRGFDEQRWLKFVAPIVNTLQSSKPMAVVPR
jgi:hypothetical protein